MRGKDGRLRFAASDVSNFLECRHLTRLDIARSFGLVKAPAYSDMAFESLLERGRTHEARVLRSFKERGWTVAEVANPFTDLEHAWSQTREALASEPDVIYQAALQHESQIGYPDFLVRASLIGGQRGYEVIDAKLARSAKARALLQATYYSRLLTQVVETVPERMHLALGDQELVTFDVSDFAAYERQVFRLLGEFSQPDPIFPPDDTYPEPVEHCAICSWRYECIQRRQTDDDLSLVAGISSRQRKRLKESDITSRRALATLDGHQQVQGIGAQSLSKIRQQARLQVEGEDANESRWELIDPEERGGELVAGRGLLGLPEPAPGDLFFDIEGSRYYSEDGREFGLQYLFGIVNPAEQSSNEAPPYTAYWAFDREGERQAFEKLMDFLFLHLSQYPDAHIYHYNHYEPTALEHLSELHLSREDVLRFLMGRFATREEELDDLLRRRVFVDLYRVFRQGVRASVESYSLKRLEPFFGFEREVSLDVANEHILLFDAALDEGRGKENEEAQRVIQGYNEDDCRATLLLRDWLEARRKDLADKLGHELRRPVKPEIPQDRTPPEVKDLRDQLQSDLPSVAKDWSDKDHARALMAELLEYHRREANPAWWRYFYLKELNDEELVKERDAISGLVWEKQVDAVARSVLDQYTFPPQELSLEAGKRVENPNLGTTFDLWDLDEGTGNLVLKRGPKAQKDPHPTALILTDVVYRTETHRENLRSLAREVIEAGDAPWPSKVAFDLLLRRRPRTSDSGQGPLMRGDEEGVDAARRIALCLEDSCLPIQGPPGTGKTYIGANQILDLTEAGKQVGITAMSHSVISNILDEIAEVAEQRGVEARIGQRADRDQEAVSSHIAGSSFQYVSNPDALSALKGEEVDVVGGTSWLWTREEFEHTLDVLVVDEAGQMSLADVLACSRSARSLILLGDPQQLTNPMQGSHPPIVPRSALDHALGGAATMRDDLGLFIPRTRRMHPLITAFTSEVFYEGRLTGIDGLERQALLGTKPFEGSGIRIVDVAHEGNSNSSLEEAQAIVSIIQNLIGGSWRDRLGEEHELGLSQILIVTPFNAQIRQIRQELQGAGLSETRVGTVDKFQGRQAPVVIYSMASSSAEDAPRGMSFLYNLNRLNVATSRAMCMAIAVASPDLVRVFARTPRQMQLANALCRLRELSTA